MSPTSLAPLVDLAIATDRMTHDGDGYGSQQLERTVMILLVDRLPDPALRHAIEVAADLPTGRARRMALLRAQRRLASDPAVRRILDAVVAHTGLLPHSPPPPRRVTSGIRGR